MGDNNSLGFIFGKKQPVPKTKLEQLFMLVSIVTALLPLAARIVVAAKSAWQARQARKAQDANSAAS